MFRFQSQQSTVDHLSSRDIYAVRSPRVWSVCTGSSVEYTDASQVPTGTTVCPSNTNMTLANNGEYNDL